MCVILLLFLWRCLRIPLQGYAKQRFGVCFLRMFDDEYLHITKDGNDYSLFAVTKGFYWNEVISLMVDFNGLDKYKPNEKIKINKIDFGMSASSNSNFFTSNYKGEIYLLEYSESEAKLYFDNLTFSLPDGAYVLDGKLTFSMKNE